jgi:hypothetical protein
MAETEIQQPALPDYVLDADAVLKDESTTWRYGRAPDYSNTRRVYEESTSPPRLLPLHEFYAVSKHSCHRILTYFDWHCFIAKTRKHEAGSLPDLVEKLVKNWEIEASFKTDIKDWRTIDHANYTFAVNGGPPQSAEHMLKVGTYNAIITPNEYYSPQHSDLASSHKTFKRMMPTFAWEVLEVYSGPPKVTFKWRHWGTMRDDYVGYNAYALYQTLLAIPLKISPTSPKICRVLKSNCWRNQQQIEKAKKSPPQPITALSTSKA